MSSLISVDLKELFVFVNIYIYMYIYIYNGAWDMMSRNLHLPWRSGFRRAAKPQLALEERRWLRPGAAVCRGPRDPLGPKPFVEQLRSNRWLWLSKSMGSTIRLGWVNSPPILEPILVGFGMFTGGTIWISTHGQADFDWFRTQNFGEK